MGNLCVGPTISDRLMDCPLVMSSPVRQPHKVGIRRPPPRAKQLLRPLQRFHYFSRPQFVVADVPPPMSINIMPPPNDFADYCRMIYSANTGQKE